MGFLHWKGCKSLLSLIGSCLSVCLSVSFLLFLSVSFYLCIYHLSMHLIYHLSIIYWPREKDSESISASTSPWVIRDIFPRVTISTPFLGFIYSIASTWYYLHRWSFTLKSFPLHLFCINSGSADYIFRKMLFLELSMAEKVDDSYVNWIISRIIQKSYVA